MASDSAIASPGDTREGFLYALAAYVMWGFLPLYMKAVAHIPASEVVAHRIVWSVPLAAIVLVWLGRTADFRRAIRDRRILALAALTAAIITVNWGIYVWAIGQGRALETALGYYINPLFSILLGAVFLGEKLTRAQMVAIGLAACAVVILTVHAGGLPWVSLALTVSWGAYALCKRTIPIGAAQGFFLEVLLLLIPALGYIGWLAASGQGHFAAMEMSDTGLLLFAGVVTAAPLITYATGAKLLRLSTIGIMQYIAPTMIFLTAVFVFGEPFDMTRGIAFCFIWAALVVYSWSLFAERRREAAKPPAA